MTLMRCAWKLLIVLIILVSAIAQNAVADTTQTAIDDVLAAARARGCQSPTELLDSILCRGAMRVGVRFDYPGFGAMKNNILQGYDVDVARAIADRLGVRMNPVQVSAATRIAMVSQGDVDLVIATMSHSVTRDRQLHFVRPHYYASRTSVVGPRELHLPQDNSIAGRTVCVPLGNVSNTVLGHLGARLMIFDQPQHLLDALRFDQCSLVAHDDSFFAESMNDPAFAARFEEKFSVLPTPWGIGIGESHTAALARLLSLVVTDFHRRGVLVGLAQKNRVADKFLIEQQAVWSDSKCIMASGDSSPDCMLEPVKDSDTPTTFAASVTAGETWLRTDLGIRAIFPMLKGQQAFALFEQGMINTLILVAGAIAATVGFALLLQFGLRQHRRLIRLPVHWLTALLQSSPIVLLLILGYFLATAMMDYGSGVALCTAIIVIGLSNGSYAGAAMADAARTLITDAGAQPPLSAVLRRSATQVTSFAVNAARASAVASFIGTPELLTALTDIASVSTERRTTYAILLVFYLAVVMAVVGLAGLFTRWAGHEEAVA